MKTKCRRCGAPRLLSELDAKPELTRQMKRVRQLHGALHMLEYAADHGYDFTRLECEGCYGPGFVNSAE